MATDVCNNPLISAYARQVFLEQIVAFTAMMRLHAMDMVAVEIRLSQPLTVLYRRESAGAVQVGKERTAAHNHHRPIVVRHAVATQTAAV